jgi:hypothetical protein
MMRNTRIYVLVLLMALVPFGLFAGGDKEAEAPVASGNSVMAGENWGFSWKFLPDEIEFTVTAPTTGWVAIGFNPSRMMKDAHYILGYVENGQLVVRDDYGNGIISHVSDDTLGGKQDVRAIGGTEEQGVTTIVFALPLNSGDEFDEVFTQGTSYKVLLAYGAEDADNFTAKHKGRTSLDVVLQ